MRSRFTGAHCGSGGSQGWIRFARWSCSTRAATAAGPVPPRRCSWTARCGTAVVAAAARIAAASCRRCRSARTRTPVPDRSRAHAARRRRPDRRRDRAARPARRDRRRPTTPAARSRSCWSRAARSGSRKLVLTPCDALEVFPPALFKPLFAARALRRTLLAAFLQPLRVPARAAAADRVRLADQARERRDARALGARRRCATARSCATPRTSPRHVDPRRCCSTPRRSCATFEGEVVIALAARGPLLPGRRSGRRLAAQFRDATLRRDRRLRTRSCRSTGRTRSRRSSDPSSISAAPAAAAASGRARCSTRCSARSMPEVTPAAVMMSPSSTTRAPSTHVGAEAAQVLDARCGA